MLLQVTLRILLIAGIAINVQSKQYQPKFCAECEEEVWEEVPCDALYSSSSTTTATPVAYSPSTTTPLPSTTATPPITPATTTTTTTKPTAAPTTSSSAYPITSTTGPLVYATLHNSSAQEIDSRPGYKKCYCECKSGCREFCRKIVLNPDTSKQILQLSKTTQPQANGQVEIKHVHERNFVPTPPRYHAGNLSPNPYYQVQQQPLPNLAYLEQKPAYNVNPSVASAPKSPQNTGNYQHYDGNSLGFSLEEFTKLLSSDQDYANMIPKISQINYTPLSVPALPNNHAQPSYYAPPVLPQQPSYAVPIPSVDAHETINNAYANSIQETKRPTYPSQNLPTIPNLPEQPPLYPPQPQRAYPPRRAPVSLTSLDAQTAVSGGGSAAAIAISPDNYKSSCSSNPSQGYANPPVGVKPAEPSSHAVISPCAQRYAGDSSALNNLHNIDPAIDNYLRDVLYSNPPKTQRYSF